MRSIDVFFSIFWFIVFCIFIIIALIVIINVVLSIRKQIMYREYAKTNAETKEKYDPDYSFKKEWGDKKVYNQEYDQPQIVTGDHYRYKYMGEHNGFDYQRCANAGTAACVNCARRNETSYGGRYRYGMGRDCEDYEMVFRDSL